MTPTARSLAHLRRAGYLADVVERWIPGANIRRDAYGFADLLACHPVEGRIILIQVTSNGVAARRKKILTERAAEASAWLKAGGEIELHGWRKVQVDAKGTRRWALRVDRLALGDLDALTVDKAPRPPVHRRPPDRQLNLEI